MTVACRSGILELRDGAGDRLHVHAFDQRKELVSSALARDVTFPALRRQRRIGRVEHAVAGGGSPMSMRSRVAPRPACSRLSNHVETFASRPVDSESSSARRSTCDTISGVCVVHALEHFLRRTLGSSWADASDDVMRAAAAATTPAKESSEACLISALRCGDPSPLLWRR